MIELESDVFGESQANPSDWSRLARGALETLAIIGGFCAVGFIWAAILGDFGSSRRELRDASAQTLYAGGVIDESLPSPRAPDAAAPARVARSATAAPARTAAPTPVPPSVPRSVPTSVPPQARRSAPIAPHSPAETPAESRPSIWLVDGFNVLHVGLLGGRDRSKWWTESKRQELLKRVESFEEPAAELWIVFDGRHDAPQPTDGVGPRCLFAPSADAWLVERVREADDPSQLVVVTADRQVAGRARSRGAQVVSPRDFLARCPV